MVIGSSESRDSAVPLPLTCGAMARSLAKLIDDILVDAHDTDEELSRFLQVFHDEMTPRSLLPRST